MFRVGSLIIPPFVLQFSPVITEDSFPHVHHMLAYHCAYLEPDTLASSGTHCDDASDDLQNCKIEVVGGWAVGGVVSMHIPNIQEPD